MTTAWASITVAVAAEIGIVTVALSSADVAMLAIALAGICCVAPITVFKKRRTLLVGAAAGLCVAAAHLAEWVPTGAGPFRTWFLALIAIPAYVGLSALAGTFRSTLAAPLKRSEPRAASRPEPEPMRPRPVLVRPSEPEPEPAPEPVVERLVKDRRAGVEDVQRWIAFSDRYGTSVSIALVGVDEHPELDGEERTRDVGEYLERSVRETDSVSRHDDSSFLITLPHTVKSEAHALVLRLARNAIDEAGRTIRGSCVEFPFDGADLDSLLRTAEEGLHYARENGLAIAPTEEPAPDDAGTTSAS